MPAILPLKLSRRETILAAIASALAGGIAINPVSGQHLDQRPVPAELPLQESYTFAVAGLDTRTVQEDENTDVLMVSRVTLANGSVRTMSFPRDLFLEIPGVGFDKINRAYDYGCKAQNHDWNAGVGLMTETIRHNFGIEIDAVATTNFTGLAAVVDLLGGVDVNNPYDLFDGQFPTADYGTKEIFYPAGEQTLVGEQAMEFSRTRHQDGDDGRVMRQQLVLSGMLDAAQEPGNIERLPELVQQGQTAVLTNIPDEVQAQLIDAVATIDPESVIWGTMTDYIWGDTTPSGMWVYQADWSVLPGYVQGFLNGDV
jgi:LCP family protein required for cell wall assembly